ncbi:YesL family protein [Oceanobacillus sp. FSL H7-0719]|uniref:YesL family protein n=1 Tax=Oceanobacillus sp. FSL H7-0719 TaxID=2954507 RepID=UPI003249609E
MYANRFITSLDRIAVWITRIAFLNILWISYTLLGLIIGGIFPATIAALGVVRKWLMGDEEIKVWETFRRIYKQEFISANGLGWILSVIGAGLYLNFKIIEAFQGQLNMLIPFAFYLTLFFYLLIVVWSFPLKAHYEAGIFRTIINALILGLTKVHISVIIIISLFAITYFSLEVPAFILFLLFSLSALIWFWNAFRVFKTLDSGAYNKS